MKKVLWLLFVLLVLPFICGWKVFRYILKKKKTVYVFKDNKMEEESVYIFGDWVPLIAFFALIWVPLFVFYVWTIIVMLIVQPMRTIDHFCGQHDSGSFVCRVLDGMTGASTPKVNEKAEPSGNSTAADADINDNEESTPSMTVPNQSDDDSDND